MEARPPVPAGKIRLTSASGAEIEVDWHVFERVITRLGDQGLLAEHPPPPQFPQNTTMRPPTEMTLGQRPAAKPIKRPRLNCTDGFRWWKYGQKKLARTNTGREYYKCMHPGCNARKHIEFDPSTGETLTETCTAHSHEDGTVAPP
eukprot:TRINITY_DN9592_c0_g1_i2.p1 TRINITY_DN9592_c0_g1~~TRINITY_DN9592_c0_g1_i2.p1  ORF type:complete len:146 (-),score=7.25 TRINITY_DN9592_c0_g1_i2:188-625(-)